MANTIYPRSSPYYETPVEKGPFLDVMINRPIPKINTDVLWTITAPYEYRPDLLAYQLYNNSKLWWVFASRNPDELKNPVFDFVVNTQIYIPNIETLKRALGI